MKSNPSYKINSPLFIFLSILVQLIAVPIVYGFFESIASISSDSAFGLDFHFLQFSVVNYTILFSVIIVTSVQETTKSELLASVMNVVWILFIWDETNDAMRNRPYEYIIFMLCISLTIPIRILFRKRFHSSKPD